APSARAYDRVVSARGVGVGLVIAAGCVAAACVAAGCASTLPESEWVTEQPRGACVVAIEHTDGTGSWTLEHHHDAEGRVLSGAARLRYHGRAWERFEYDAQGRLAEIFSYE